MILPKTHYELSSEVLRTRLGLDHFMDEIVAVHGNDPSYDDWYYGTEPIPGDTSWVQPRTLPQLHRRLCDTFAAAETTNMERLAALAIREILSVSSETLSDLKNQHPELLHNHYCQ